jgi:hypothetical protein
MLDQILNLADTVLTRAVDGFSRVVQRGRHFSIPKDITRATLYGSAQVKLAGSDTSPLPL